MPRAERQVLFHEKSGHFYTADGQSGLVCLDVSNDTDHISRFVSIAVIPQSRGFRGIGGFLLFFFTVADSGAIRQKQTTNDAD